MMLAWGTTSTAHHHAGPRITGTQDGGEQMNDHAMTRRAWLAAFARTFGTGVALSALLPMTSHADVPGAPTRITVYKDPSCGCCTKWVDHLRSANLTVDVHDRTDMDALKSSL